MDKRKLHVLITRFLSNVSILKVQWGGIWYNISKQKSIKYILRSEKCNSVIQKDVPKVIYSQVNKTSCII